MVEHPRWREESPSEKFADYIPVNAFVDEKKEILEQAIHSVFQSLNLDESYQRLLKEMVYFFIRSKVFAGSATGLVFSGFGEEQLFPGCIPIEVGGVIDNRIRFKVNEDQQVQIDDKVIGAIRPFAQTDVINTFIQGMDPNLDHIFIETVKTFLDRYTSFLNQTLQNAGHDISGILQNLDLKRVGEELHRSISEARQQKHVNPTMDTVSILSKEDLAEMAESLIYLTFLKRRISFAEESVGGPVDVALISKGDGFVWIKRKHYFEPELNHQFFQNYIKI